MQEVSEKPLEEARREIPDKLGLAFKTKQNPNKQTLKKKKTCFFLPSSYAAAPKREALDYHHLHFIPVLLQY